MKILILCNKSPYPPKEGGSLAMYNIINGLIKQNHFVKVCALSTNKLKIEYDKVPSEFIEKTSFESVHLNTDIKIGKAFINFFSNRSYHIERFYDVSVKEKIIEILEKDTYDVIQLESVYMVPYVRVLRKFSNAKIVLRSHNVEHLIWDRISKGEKNFLKKLYLKLQTQRLKKFELSHINSYDGIASITAVDALYFRNNGCQIPIVDIPFGIDSSCVKEIDVKKEKNTVFFLGSLNWMPNIEGLRWFLESVWEKVSDVDANIQFYIAGRHAPHFLKSLNMKNVHFVGEVENALDFMCSKSLMVVPLFSGSGMRVKIIEAMLAENTVISTTVGAEGIDYTVNDNIIIADTPQDFVTAILKCAKNPEMCDAIGVNARELVMSKYMNDNIILKLVDFYTDLLNT